MTEQLCAVTTAAANAVTISDAIAGGEGYIDTYTDRYGIQTGGDVTPTDRLVGVLSLQEA